VLAWQGFNGFDEPESLGADLSNGHFVFRSDGAVGSSSRYSISAIRLSAFNAPST
jgi:hypothetical protein